MYLERAKFVRILLFVYVLFFSSCRISSSSKGADDHSLQTARVICSNLYTWGKMNLSSIFFPWEGEIVYTVKVVVALISLELAPTETVYVPLAIAHFCATTFQ